MRKIRVQYDAYNRQFTTLDRSGSGLRDGEIYLVLDDFSPSEFDAEPEFSEDELQFA